MKLTAPFTILKKKFNEMDFIRYSMHSKKSLRLKDCMITLGKCSNQIPVLCIATKKV